ncbi:MAG: zinc metalloprotease HtpX [Candidatus Blackburnbacteria bacterium RIFCSPHIGHO2_02_FULL_39_13]|uniref:Protease HtpX homolog n=1 Tax=Candidatus Blackburnbacteria bacterium RIFCSPLOWO2_01_FULL_40_20 TaxID=1797519 RepID=A0A1G1VCS8_9BACT|nr:MAG: Protease HtpX-like protein [Microgenomates group bacterium GW2011_GWA2_39_19]OGY06958.1 MAG: zinc metalloprotease HtpX [Candidatus Blackburnbacteria bacterium RIFCSPHIGHO2_01_FULL_40_17]OGY09625.1 MAG: zinc metalloprotease HtpX [Candidatus Blackburnbacteria bacterium RIFCSPHIGHO2_02_FULL_39_13]OGY13214.1 MAG: zinc metalloprotease HtpX [Candidatus Blackburnbacteria bacterium RIFCSPLOWO2_01_FULL_40_20]OGY15504.1 MAG: zinc metalloprotease HtpX [Candidatus Blackburnbacteria bacterium RIFCSP
MKNIVNVYEAVDSNKRKSILVMFFFTLFIVGFSYILVQAFDLGLSFLGWALILSGVMSFASYWWSDKIILSISGARPADKKRDFHFYTVAENMALASSLPMPKLYVIEDTATNAFATGRDPAHGVVCATRGLLEKLDRTELEGVIAHEMSHIGNYDMRLMSIVTILAGMVVLIADWALRFSIHSDSDRDNRVGAILLVVGFVLALLSPIIAELIKLSISRRREFLADATAAKITRFPEGLARALEKIAKDKEPLEAANKATAHLYISNPLKNHHDAIGWFAGLFSTHPPVEERIKALRQMA